MTHRSYLFAPGHNEKLLARVFDAGADAVILDLEDAVPAEAKDRARAMVVEALADRVALVRVNAPRSPECEADLKALAGRVSGIRVPKCETADDVRWVADRAPGTPLICAIETASGVMAAASIAAVSGVAHLSMGGVDLQRDLHAGAGNLQTLYVRSHLVVVSRAAGLAPPIDSVYPQLGDDAGLREHALFAKSLGFFGMSAIHPRQIPILHEVYTPSRQDLDWAHAVLDAFDAAGGAACLLPSGEFVDAPVAERARRLIHLAAATPEATR